MEQTAILIYCRLALETADAPWGGNTRLIVAFMELLQSHMVNSLLFVSHKRIPLVIEQIFIPISCQWSETLSLTHEVIG